MIIYYTIIYFFLLPIFNSIDKLIIIFLFLNRKKTLNDHDHSEQFNNRFVFIQNTFEIRIIHLF